MITLSNGYRFEYMAASGALAYDGQGWPWEQPLRIPGWLHPRWEIFDPSLFTPVTKTFTPQPHAGSPYWDCVRFIPHGVANAVALKNPGIGWFYKNIGPRLEHKPTRLMASITADDAGTLALMAQRLDGFNLAGIEFNASCPNTDNALIRNIALIIDGCRAIKSNSRLPLLLKLSVVHPPEHILRHIVGLVEAISINSVPWQVMYPAHHPLHHGSPLKHRGHGAVSGGAAQTQTWPYAERLASSTSIPIIGPSVWWFKDLATLRTKGMKAISFGSIWLRYPWRPTLYVRRDRAMVKWRPSRSVVRSTVRAVPLGV